MSGGYAVASVPKLRRSITGANQIKRSRQYTEDRPMKLTFKQRFRNWLMDESADDYAHTISVDENKLQSEGLRLQIYKASGGFVIETRSYDRRKDENAHTMHVVTDEQDLGDSLGKIVMMEALRG